MNLCQRILFVHLLALFCIVLKHSYQIYTTQDIELNEEADIFKTFDIKSSLLSNQNLYQQQKRNSHIGQFQSFQAPIEISPQLSNSLSMQNFSDEKLLPYIPINKKIDHYIFSYYNWYRIQFKFTDLEHTSFLDIRIVSLDRGSQQITQKIGFKLPVQFYTQTHKQNGDKNTHLKVNFQSKDFSLNIGQFTTSELKGHSDHDGYLNQQMLNLNPNKTQLTQSDYDKFGSEKTVTIFNMTYKRKDYEIKANLTHVVRHNQCITNYQYQENLLKHKCMGGYGMGKLIFNRFQVSADRPGQHKKEGTWIKSAFNLNSPRTRTIFTGYRSTRDTHYKYNFNGKSLPKVQWSWKVLEIDFVGFNKLQYYSKGDQIQKQRWVGMSVSRKFKQNQSNLISKSHQDYLFVNGHMHPIKQMQFEIDLNISPKQQNSAIFFKSVKGNSNPQFYIDFYTFSKKTICENSFLYRRNSLVLDGYWSGWIDERTLSQNYISSLRDKPQIKIGEWQYVSFYNITGTIRLVQGRF